MLGVSLCIYFPPQIFGEQMQTYLSRKRPINRFLCPAIYSGKGINDLTTKLSPTRSLDGGNFTALGFVPITPALLLQTVPTSFCLEVPRLPTKGLNFTFCLTFSLVLYPESRRKKGQTLVVSSCNFLCFLAPLKAYIVHVTSHL